MNKENFVAGFLLVLAGLTGLIYGVGINLRGMLARGSPQDFTFITVYLAEWGLILAAGLVLVVAAARRK